MTCGEVNRSIMYSTFLRYESMKCLGTRAFNGSKQTFIESTGIHDGLRSCCCNNPDPHFVRFRFIATPSKNSFGNMHNFLHFEVTD
jgi:hypothetical protein